MKSAYQTLRRQVLCLSLPVALLASASALADDTAAVKAGLKKLLPDMEPTAVNKTAMDGLYEVVIGTDVVYMSADGRHLMVGRLIDTENGTNLTSITQGKLRVKAMDAISEDQMVIFGPKDAKHTVTVFTDIDCPYCAKLHNDMDGYNKAGIRVRYLFYPRAGLNTPSYDKAVSVWCAKDRNAAMTDAKRGTEVEAKTCENPVEAHMRLGAELGVSGTPAIVLDSGELLPGYLPPAKLAAVLAEKDKSSSN